MRQRESSARTIAIIIACIAMWLIVFNIDKIRLEKYNQKPWFSFPIKLDENKNGTYYGLFYKIIVENDYKGNINYSKITYWFDN